MSINRTKCFSIVIVILLPFATVLCDDFDESDVLDESDFNPIDKHGNDNNTEDIYYNDNDNSIKRKCENIDIRNRMEDFKMIESCEIITGYLQIVLVDKRRKSSKDNYNYTFPKLR